MYDIYVEGDQQRMQPREKILLRVYSPVRRVSYYCTSITYVIDIRVRGEGCCLQLWSD